MIICILEPQFNQLVVNIIGLTASGDFAFIGNEYRVRQTPDFEFVLQHEVLFQSNRVIDWYFFQKPRNSFIALALYALRFTLYANYFQALQFVLFAPRI